MQRRGAQAEQQRADLLARLERRRLGVNRLGEARRRLPGRSRERDQRRTPRRPSLLAEQRDDPRHRRRLPGTRPPADDGEAADHRGRRGRPLTHVGAGREQSLEPSREGRQIDVRSGGVAERDEVLGDPPLLVPVAIEVQPRALEPERRRRVARAAPRLGRDERAGAHGLHPLLRRRPRQQAEIDRLLGLDGRGHGDRRQVDEHMAEPGSADGEGRREDHRGIGLAGEPRDPLGDVHVRAREHADPVELEQRRLGAHRDPGIEPVQERRHGHAHLRGPPSSRTSLRARTSAPGGCHAKTPHGVPSSTGVSAPAIPRRNRYSTPARCSSGS